MYVVAVVLTDVCSYGGLFCDKPHYMMTSALLAGLWGKFVSMR